jgi:ferritin-like metal-binding protein YciE
MSLFETLRDLYINELRDLYSTETQLVEALPKMAEAAHAPELKAAFSAHLEETKEHVRRLERIFAGIPAEAGGETCEAMEGLIEEGEEYAEAGGDPNVCDAGLIGAAQRVEHYEMAGYGTVRNLARSLGEEKAAQILQETLDEEGAADHKLTEIANEINSQASLA